MRRVHHVLPTEPASACLFSCAVAFAPCTHPPGGTRCRSRLRWMRSWPCAISSIPRIPTSTSVRANGGEGQREGGRATERGQAGGRAGGRAGRRAGGGPTKFSPPTLTPIQPPSPAPAQPTLPRPHPTRPPQPSPPPQSTHPPSLPPFLLTGMNACISNRCALHPRVQPHGLYDLHVHVLRARFCDGHGDRNVCASAVRFAAPVHARARGACD